MTPLWRIGSFLRERQRWVLIALLVVLHLTLVAGADTAVGLMCWLVDVGLFILWQPFIQAERKLDASALLLFVLLLAGGAWVFGWWLLVIWVVVLASLLGGRVMLLGHLPTRVYYLLAFAYLLVALLVWLVPRVVPDAGVIGPSLDKPFAWLAPLLFVVMLLMPRTRHIYPPGGGMVDFFYSILIFLLISVLVLGSLAFMLLQKSLYIEAVFKTLLSMSAMLLMISWAWNPRPGFSGIGVFLSRYLLTIGLPFEVWLQRLMDSAESESDPDRFLARAFEGMLELPWVTGGAWSSGDGAHAESGFFGQESPFRRDFQNQPLVLTLYTQHKLSPSLIWLFHLLAKLTNEYFVTKQRARELQQMSYLRAVHETGARLTHDVKNLLQSLNNLCFMAQLPDDTEGARLNLLIQRQLPQITQRLQQTLDKLQAPQGEVGSVEISADAWWAMQEQLYAQDDIVFDPVVIDASARLPGALFDSVMDNLLHNAMLKRQCEGCLEVRVTLAPDAKLLCVGDNGSAVRADVAKDLLRMPVPSENGFGIGLYHAARLAESHGYELRLASNEAGRVCFELKANDPGKNSR